MFGKASGIFFPFFILNRIEIIFVISVTLLCFLYYLVSIIYQKLTLMERGVITITKVNSNTFSSSCFCVQKRTKFIRNLLTIIQQEIEIQKENITINKNVSHSRIRIENVKLYWAFFLFLNSTSYIIRGHGRLFNVAAFLIENYILFSLKTYWYINVCYNCCWYNKSSYKLVYILYYIRPNKFQTWFIKFNRKITQYLLLCYIYYISYIIRCLSSRVEQFPTTLMVCKNNMFFEFPL